jgi:hypothetical protein
LAAKTKAASVGTENRHSTNKTKIIRTPKITSETRASSSEKISTRSRRRSKGDDVETKITGINDPGMSVHSTETTSNHSLPPSEAGTTEELEEVALMKDIHATISTSDQEEAEADP